MKILHVVRQFHPCVGGIERFTLDLCRFTLSRGHTCEVLTLNRDFATGRRLAPRDEVDGIAIRRVPYFGPNRYRMAPAALAQLGDCDLVHVHCVDFFVDFLSLTKPIHRRPLLLSTHGGFFHSAWGRGIKQAFFRAVTPLSLRAVDRVVCDSPQDFDLFSRIARNKCQLIEDGVDYESFASVRKRLRPGLLVHVGRTDANKRLALLIRTFALVARRHPEARLALVGPDWLGEWARLRQVALDEDIADRVEFVGRVEEQELKRWLAEAHFFVSASAYEGFGIAAVEAMATGTVPILSDIVAFRHLTQGGTCGKLADFDNPAEAAEAILRALAMSPGCYEELSIRAREAASRYSWQVVGEKFLSLYSDLTGTPTATQTAESPGH
ncbi:MAG: glycosyltransferase family 4 protein [Chloroflexota bacterium]